MLFTNEFLCKTENGANKRNFAKDPAVVNLNGTYYLYFSTYANLDERLRIGIAKSTDTENWEFCGLVPLTEDCEKNGIGAPGAFFRDNIIHLFYQTYGNREKDAICHAVSVDGINFVKDESNPVFSPSTDWCCGRAIDADVVEFEGRLFLYFATRDGAFKVQKVGVASASLDSGYGREDFTEGKKAPCIAPELFWEGECIEAPATISRNDRIYMFYGGAYNCHPQQIGVAVSENGIDFERLFDEPFIKNGNPGEWNESESGHPYVFEDTDGRIYLFYQGSPDMGKSWYISKCEIEFVDGKPIICGER